MPIYCISEHGNVCKVTFKVIKLMFTAKTCVPLLCITTDNTFKMYKTQQQQQQDINLDNRIL